MLRNCVAALPLWLAAVLPLAAADPLEYQVKAAFLYNFARFTTWPAAKLPQANDPIVFCALDRDPFADTLDATLKGKTIDAHPLAVRRVPRVDDMRACHVAYLGTPDAARPGAGIDVLTGGSVLSVYEGDQILRNGSIRFFLEEHKVRFEVNAAATEREQLQLSSRLLSVARVVRD